MSPCRSAGCVFEAHFFEAREELLVWEVGLDQPGCHHVPRLEKGSLLKADVVVIPSNSCIALLWRATLRDPLVPHQQLDWQHHLGGRCCQQVGEGSFCGAAGRLVVSCAATRLARGRSRRARRVVAQEAVSAGGARRGEGGEVHGKEQAEEEIHHLS